MLRTLITLLIALSYPVGYAGERPVEIDSHESAFHIMLHDKAGFCLVCYTEVMKKPWRGEWEKLEIEATIVEVYRGKRKIGDRIKFTRVMDGKFGDISHLQGSLNFVRFDKSDNPDSKVTFVDGQDPQAVFGYSSEFHAVAKKHKQAEQGGADQPATAPEPKSESGDKPKPESEGRSL